jgi:hypothetical protein
MIGKSVALAGLLATAAIGLTACGSTGSRNDSHGSGPASAGQTASVPANTGDTSTGSSEASTATNTGGGDTNGGALTSLPKDVCALAPHDVIASATGQQIASAPLANTTNATATTCIWADASDDHEVSVKIEPHTADWKARFMKAGLASNKPVTDLGASANGHDINEAKGWADAQLNVDAGCCLLFVDSDFPQVSYTQLVPIAKAALKQ